MGKYNIIVNAYTLYGHLGQYCTHPSKLEIYIQFAEDSIYIYNHHINPFPNKPLFLRLLQYKSFENTMGKVEIAPFPTAFSIILENFSPFSLNSKLSSANSFSSREPKTCCLEKG